MFKIIQNITSILRILFLIVQTYYWKDIRMESWSYKNEIIARKYLKNMQNNPFLKVKNSLLELEIFFTELEDRVLKEREVKIKREMCLYR